MNHHQGSINSSQLPLLLPSSCRYLNGYADGSGPPALTDDLVDAIKNNAIGIKLHKCNVNDNELSSELVAEMSENALGGPLGLDSKINTHPSTSKNKEMILVMAQIKRVSSWILKINWIFLAHY
jgi:hypothetical protein